MLKINLTKLLEKHLSYDEKRNSADYYHPTEKRDCTSMETSYAFELEGDIDEDIRAAILVGDGE
jgi:hypothetical protein